MLGVGVLTNLSWVLYAIDVMQIVLLEFIWINCDVMDTQESTISAIATLTPIPLLGCRLITSSTYWSHLRLSSRSSRSFVDNAGPSWLLIVVLQRVYGISDFLLLGFNF